MNRHKTALIVGGVLAAVVVLLAAFLFYWYRRRTRRAYLVRKVLPFYPKSASEALGEVGVTEGFASLIRNNEDGHIPPLSAFQVTELAFIFQV